MSMNRSKGLTVEAVIIAACENDIIPRPDAPLAEERRLMYVAMTRARRFLYCTWAQRRTGPTARAGAPRVQERRTVSSLLRTGRVSSEPGDAYVARHSGRVSPPGRAPIRVGGLPTVMIFACLLAGFLIVNKYASECQVSRWAA